MWFSSCSSFAQPFITCTASSVGKEKLELGCCTGERFSSGETSKVSYPASCSQQGYLIQLLRASLQALSEGGWLSFTQGLKISKHRQTPLLWVPGPGLSHPPGQGAFPNLHLGSPSLGHLAPPKGWLHPTWNCPSRSDNLLSDSPQPPLGKASPAPISSPQPHAQARSAVSHDCSPVSPRPSLPGATPRVATPVLGTTASHSLLTTFLGQTMYGVMLCDQSHHRPLFSLVPTITPRSFSARLLPSHHPASTDGRFTQFRVSCV